MSCCLRRSKLTIIGDKGLAHAGPLSLLKQYRPLSELCLCFKEPFDPGILVRLEMRSLQGELAVHGDYGIVGCIVDLT